MLSVRTNLNNRFFSQQFDCTNRTQSVNQYGEASYIESPFIINASIQPTSGRELYFLPESALLTENITIFSKEQLVSSASNGYGDIVIYQGQRYQVAKVKTWTTHYESIATLEPINAE